MASPPTSPGPGRPSTGARERILEGCLEVLKKSGYAGLTIAKVAVVSGESKALISYHYGSKTGLVAAAARELGDEITRDVLAGVDGATTTEEITAGAAGALWALLDRDERIARVYFDLNAVSVVDPAVCDVLREVTADWRAVIADLLAHAQPPVAADLVDPLTTLLIAGLQGLTLEHIERGATLDLVRARELFVQSVCAVAGT